MLVWVLSIIPILLPGCDWKAKKVESDPLEPMSSGPDSAAIVLVASNMYVKSHESTAGYLGRKIVGSDEDWSDGQLYLLEGRLRNVETKEVVRGYSVGFNLLFQDVPPGRYRLISIDGYRTLSDADRKDSCKGGSGCPKYWIFRFDLTSSDLQELWMEVDPGDIHYVGWFGLTSRPPSSPYAKGIRFSMERVDRDVEPDLYKYFPATGDRAEVEKFGENYKPLAEREVEICKLLAQRLTHPDWIRALEEHIATLSDSLGSEE